MFLVSPRGAREECDHHLEYLGVRLDHQPAELLGLAPGPETTEPPVEHEAGRVLQGPLAHLEAQVVDLVVDGILGDLEAGGKVARDGVDGRQMLLHFPRPAVAKKWSLYNRGLRKFMGTLHA